VASALPSVELPAKRLPEAAALGQIEVEERRRSPSTALQEVAEAAAAAAAGAVLAH